MTTKELRQHLDKLTGYCIVSDNGEDTVQPLDFNKQQTFWYVECDSVTFRANNLNEAMGMWNLFKQPKAFCVGRVG